MQSIKQRVLLLAIIAAAVICVLLIACQNRNANLSQAVPTASQSPAPTPEGTPWVMPVDVNNTINASQDDYYDLGWKSFIALNWPALDGQRGAPDTAKKIGAQAADGSFLPVVWETYKVPAEVFLPGAAAPPDWNSPPPPPPSACTQVPKGAQVLQMISKAGPTILDDLTQAGFPLSPVKKTRGPLIDQNQNYVRYDERLNQSEFVYVQKYQYYNADIQQAAVKANPTTFQDPPQGFEDYVQPLPDYARQGAVEIKASWRVLDPKKDILDRYYRQQSWLVDPDGKCSGPFTMGLVGLHILRLTKTTHATWYWATFEQIDNVAIEAQSPSRPSGQPLTPSFNPNGPPAPPQFPSGYSYEPPAVEPGKPLPPNPKPVDVWRITDVAADAEAKNKYYRGQLGDTVWRYYKMIGTMNPYVNNSAQPQKFWVPATNKVYINTADMANTTMETYLQANSCIVCHAYAVPLGAATFKPLPQFQIFTFFLRHAQRPSASPSPSASPPK